MDGQMKNINFNLKNEAEFPGLIEQVKQWRNPIQLKKFRKQNTNPYSRSKFPNGQPKGLSVNIQQKSLLNVNAKEFR